MRKIIATIALAFVVTFVHSALAEDGNCDARAPENFFLPSQVSLKSVNPGYGSFEGWLNITWGSQESSTNCLRLLVRPGSGSNYLYVWSRGTLYDGKKALVPLYHASPEMKPKDVRTWSIEWKNGFTALVHYDEGRDGVQVDWKWENLAGSGFLTRVNPSKVPPHLIQEALNARKEWEKERDRIPK